VFGKLGVRKTSKADAGTTNIPETGTRHCQQSTLVKNEAIASAYLRAAQAYILISMPTGTSTIFGAFQAILALLKVKPDELRPANKVIRNQNFASKIFFVH
jgi:hypothetical protein